MKKILCIILSLALITLCSGCSGDNGGASAGTAESRAADNAPEMPDGGDPPAMPDGQQPPEPPDGEAPDGLGAPPDLPDGKAPGGVGTPPAKPNGDFPGGEPSQGASANTLSESTAISGTAYSSTANDENAIRIDGAEVNLTSVTVTKSAGDCTNSDSGDFYGMNAALLATNSATVTISGASVSSAVRNGNGVFSYGDGTSVSIKSSSITTSGDCSGGIMTTGGGSMEATALTVKTSGNSSAAIRTDRGGGRVTVSKGSYTTTGTDSPAIYSTAEVSVSGAALKAEGSEALVIEGKNSITLENCTVSGCMSDTEGASSSENVHNIMLYQSMSGDADVGTSTLKIQGGSVTGKNGDMFYITNTHAYIYLNGTTLINEDDKAFLMRVCGNSGERGWGRAGENGAQVQLVADGQKLEGDILIDSISSLSLTLKNDSHFVGSISILSPADGSAQAENAVVTVGAGCTWTLNGNCTISRLENNGLIDFNGYSITLADGSVLK